MKNKSSIPTPFTIWLTGLPSSGKSTIASLIQKQLNKNQISATVLDGDELRKGLNKDLDLSAAGRKENIRRSVEVCKLMMSAGVVVIAALISPFDEDREWAREYIGRKNFILVYLDCPLEVCEARDVKGLYQKARNGMINNLTGLNSPYEIPCTPDLALKTHLATPEICSEKIFDFLRGFQLSRTPRKSSYEFPI